MEINQFGDTILGVIPTADVVEGRMVCLTSHSWSKDFGSLTDLPGAKVPSTADEAKRARYIITWQQTEQKPPYYQTLPSLAWSTRYGFEQAANLPATSVTIYTTYPGMQDGKTIPSGTPALAFGEGIYTIPSGAFIYSSGLETAGCLLSVSYSGADAGKLQAQATYDADLVVGKVVEFNSGSYTIMVQLNG